MWTIKDYVLPMALYPYLNLGTKSKVYLVVESYDNDVGSKRWKLDVILKNSPFGACRIGTLLCSEELNYAEAFVLGSRAKGSFIEVDKMIKWIEDTWMEVQ